MVLSLVCMGCHCLLGSAAVGAGLPTVAVLSPPVDSDFFLAMCWFITLAV